MSNRSGTHYSAPTDADRRPVMLGVSTADGITPLPIEIDPNTGQVQTSASLSGSSFAINDGTTTSRKASVLSLTDSNPIAMALVDGNGDQITSFGGGTQYTDAGTPPAHPVGTMPIYNNGGSWSQVSTTNGLPIQVIGTPAVTVSGVATASNQTGGSQKTQIVDGSGNVISSVSNALSVNSLSTDSVDANNSSTATLTGNSTFTGTGTSTIGYSYIEIYVYSDHDSAANGVKIEFSSDNSNWNDSSLFTFTSGGSAPNDGQTFGAAARARYYRVVYTNGSTNQTAFRLQSILRVIPTMGDMVTMSTVPNSTNHASLTKASIVGLTTAGGGAFVDVKVNPSGTLTVDASNSTGLTAAVTQSTSPWIVAGGGTAGSAASGVVTVQGIASMTPVQVSQATAANLNATVVQGTASNLKAQVTGAGSAGTADTGVVTIQGIASMTKLLVTPDANSAINLAQVGGTNVVNGGVAGSQSVGGTVATNVAITANPINLGAQAVSSENSAVTTARQVQLVADLVGKLIVLPYANPENFVSGVATATDTTSTSLISAPASGLRNYITQITVWNSSATNTYIKIQDGSGGTTLYDVPAPATGGATINLPTPLRQPTTATAIYFAAAASANAVFISATGYKGA